MNVEINKLGSLSPGAAHSGFTITGQILKSSEGILVAMNCRNIQFCDRKSKIDYHQLQDLFRLGAFWAQERKIEDWEIAIVNSEPVISVWDGERLIGFSRATSDGIYRGTIWDVVVHPDYRGTGLGSKLVETVLSHPRMNRVERVYLMTTHQQRFYERIGFEQNSSTTMVLYHQPMSPIPTPVLQSQEFRGA